MTGVLVPRDDVVLQGLYPRLLDYAKGKAMNAVAIGAGASFGQDIVTAGYSTLSVFIRMTATAVGDLTFISNSYEDDGVTIFPRTPPGTVTVAATFSGGVAAGALQIPLGGIDKMRVIVSNSNVAAQTATVVYFLQR